MSAEVRPLHRDDHLAERIAALVESAPPLNDEQVQAVRMLRLDRTADKRAA